MSEEINLVTAFQGDRKSPKDPYRASAVLERALITCLLYTSPSPRDS